MQPSDAASPPQSSRRSPLARTALQRALAVPGGTVNLALIDALLRERQWTRTRLAQEMGMDRTWVSNVINGGAEPGDTFKVRLWALFPNFDLHELIAPASDEPGSDEGSAA